jgi:hypothetical protein
MADIASATAIRPIHPFAISHYELDHMRIDMVWFTGDPAVPCPDSP